MRIAKPRAADKGKVALVAEIFRIGPVGLEHFTMDLALRHGDLLQAAFADFTRNAAEVHDAPPLKSAS